MGACVTFLQKHPDSGVYRVRRKIPPDAQHAFQARKIFLKSLGTEDPAEAKRLAIPVLAEFDQKVDRALQARGNCDVHRATSGTPARLAA